MATATLNGGRTTSAVPAPVLRTPPRRRQPAYVALGIALAVLGGLAAAALTSGAGHRTDVLTLARAVRAGSVITDGDLAVARVGTDPRVSYLPATRRREVVGRMAAEPLAAGQLLTDAQVTSALVPAAGQQLIGVAVKPGQFPATGLAPGDAVTIIATPGDQATQRVAATPATATVYAISPPDSSGLVAVDVVVAAADGTAVAQEASTGRIALIRQPKAG